MGGKDKARNENRYIPRDTHKKKKDTKTKIRKPTKAPKGPEPKMGPAPPRARTKENRERTPQKGERTQNEPNRPHRKSQRPPTRAHKHAGPSSENLIERMNQEQRHST